MDTDCSLDIDRIIDGLNVSELKVDEDWTMYSSPGGFPYYYNAHTGESRWAEDFDNVQSASIAKDNETADWTNNEINRCDYDVSMCSSSDCSEGTPDGYNDDNSKNWDSIPTEMVSIGDYYKKKTSFVSNISTDSDDSYKPDYNDSGTESHRHRHSNNGLNKAYYLDSANKRNAKYSSSYSRTKPDKANVNNYYNDIDISDDSQYSSSSEKNRNPREDVWTAENNYNISDDSQVDSSNESSLLSANHSPYSVLGNSSEDDDDEYSQDESSESSEENSVFSDRGDLEKHLVKRRMRDRSLAFQIFKREKKIGIPVFNPNEEASFQEFLVTEEGLEAVQSETEKLEGIIAKKRTKTRKNRIYINSQKSDENITSVFTELILPTLIMIKKLLQGIQPEGSLLRKNNDLKARDLEGGKKNEKGFGLHDRYSSKLKLNIKDSMNFPHQFDVDESHEGYNSYYESAANDTEFDSCSTVSEASHSDSISSTDSDIRIVNSPLIPPWLTISSLTEAVKRSYSLSEKVTRFPPHQVTSASPRGIIEAPEILSEKITPIFLQNTAENSFMQAIFSLLLEIFSLLFHFLFLGCNIFIRKSKLFLLKILIMMNEQVNDSSLQNIKKEREVERLPYNQRELD